ncbi:MAG: helix-turn-helix domain-containing protein [Pseudomonadota bacterium]
MVAKTTHRQRSGCPIACSLDILGDHWSLLIVRNLLFLGVHEYKDMLAKEEQISSSILSDRLKKLTQEGLIAAHHHHAGGRRKLYYLTPMGKDLIHILTAMIIWADRYLSEWLAIPPAQKKLLNRDPDAFIAMTLERLATWEKENLR